MCTDRRTVLVEGGTLQINHELLHILKVLVYFALLQLM